MLLKKASSWHKIFEKRYLARIFFVAPWSKVSLMKYYFGPKNVNERARQISQIFTALSSILGFLIDFLSQESTINHNIVTDSKMVWLYQGIFW